MYPSHLHAGLMHSVPGALSSHVQLPCHVWQILFYYRSPLFLDLIVILLPFLC